eukprot:2610504-Rhodomonas_salina.2
MREPEPAIMMPVPLRTEDSNGLRLGQNCDCSHARGHLVAGARASSEPRCSAPASEPGDSFSCYAWRMWRTKGGRQY